MGFTLVRRPASTARPPRARRLFVDGLLAARGAEAGGAALGLGQLVDHARARSGEGLEAVGAAIADSFERSLRDVELLVPFSEGQTLSELHDVAGDLEREDTAEGVRVTARLPAVVAERYDRYANGDSAA